MRLQYSKRAKYAFCVHCDICFQAKNSAGNFFNMLRKYVTIFQLYIQLKKYYENRNGYRELLNPVCVDFHDFVIYLKLLWSLIPQSYHMNGWIKICLLLLWNLNIFSIFCYDRVE